MLTDHDLPPRLPEVLRRARRHVRPRAAIADAAIDPNSVGPKTVALDRVDGFVAIDDKGMVTVYSGKVDLGTGTDTALDADGRRGAGVPMRA